MDLLNTVVGIVSLVLGVFAMVASFALYRLSESGARKMQDSEQLIHEHVKELDRVFNLLYADTWSLVRDSYTSMHQQLRLGQAVANPATQAPLLVPPTTPSSLDDDKAIELSEFMLAAFTKARAGGPVTAEDLVGAAGAAGYAPTEALGALYDLTLVQRRLFIGGSEIRPASTLYQSAQEAHAAQKDLEIRALERLNASPRTVKGP